MADSSPYRTANAFRRALEDRLRGLRDGQDADIDRLRKRVAFDRLLARLFDSPEPQWILKGGYALELRLGQMARATKDIDFSIPILSDPNPDKIRSLLAERSRKEMGDWFEYLIGEAAQELDQTAYGGWRYPVEARLDGRKFSNFHLDVGVGDAIVSDPEWQYGENFLGFAGIPPAHVALLPLVQQFAEKVHAYTVPRQGGPNSRTRDLVDMVLIIEKGGFTGEGLRKAVRATFDRRKTHPVPLRLSPPPADWEAPYAALAVECGVESKTISEAFVLLAKFWSDLDFK